MSEISALLFSIQGRIERTESLLTEIRDLIRSLRDPSVQGQKPDYRQTKPPGPVDAKPSTGQSSRPLEGYYRCPVCASKEPMHYICCEHPGCPDGRDQSVYRK